MTDLNGGSSAPNDTGTEGGSNENKMLSYFGRVNYSFMDRYLLEANFRADASSLFPQRQPLGFLSFVLCRMAYQSGSIHAGCKTGSIT